MSNYTEEELKTIIDKLGRCVNLLTDVQNIIKGDDYNAYYPQGFQRLISQTSNLYKGYLRELGSLMTEKG